MMSDAQVITISGIDLSQSEPTTLEIKDLHEWVIWQFPGTNAREHHAAVKPSVPGHGWYPAVVDTKRLQVTVYGNVEVPLDSPEAASKKLVKLLAK